MNDLKMLTVEEVTDLLNTSKNTLTMLRETGALKAIKTGKNYMYSQEAVKRFQETFEGCSMDNLVNIKNSLNAVNELRGE